MIPSHFRCLQRDGSDRALVTLTLDAGDEAEPAVQVETGAGETVPSEIAWDERTLSMTLPTGGPYTIILTGSGRRFVAGRNLFVGDIWVLAGQSNMQGLGENGGAPPACDHATMLSFDRTWKPAVEPLHRLWETKDTAQYKMTPHLGFGLTSDELDRLYPGMNETNARTPIGGVGPGVFFATELTRMSGTPVGLIPCALGGSSLDMWQRTYAREQGISRADTLYWDLLDRIALAGGSVTGVLWYQGESDTVPALAPSYLERFTRFVADVRKDTGAAGLPFITVQLATAEEMDWVGETNFDAVREAQRLAAETIPDVSVVAAADLARVDHVHLSSEGQRTLGLRLARAATRYTRGCETRFSTPRLDAVTGDGDRVEVCFTDLNGDLVVTPGAPLESCFRVDDHTIVSAKARPSGVVELELDRACDRPSVSYGTGFAGMVAMHDAAGFALPVFGPVVAGVPRSSLTGLSPGS